MNIVDLLQDYRVDYKQGSEHHHVRPGWIGLDCSQCSPGSTKYKLGISISTLWCNCWTCGSQRLDDVLADALAVSSSQARIIADKLRQGRGPTSYYSPLPRAGKVTLPSGLGPLLTPHRDYLRRRGFDPDEVAHKWGIQGIGLAAKLAWRLFFPITWHGEVVSWTTRSIAHDASLRYISASPGEERVNANTLIYGEDYARHALIVVEGPLDAIRIGYGAGAIRGLTWTTEQVQKISRFPLRVVCFDNEPAAQRLARKLVNDLIVFPGETVNCVITSGKDAAEASMRDIRELRRCFLE